MHAFSTLSVVFRPTARRCRLSSGGHRRTWSTPFLSFFGRLLRARVVHCFTEDGSPRVVKVVHKHLHKGAPHAALLEPQIQNSGRNNNGHITIRHKGGGHKHHYRVVDFKRNDKDGIAAKVERLEARLAAATSAGVPS